jgi:hypothetical protein
MFCLPSRLPRKTEDERERIKQEMAEAVAAYRGPIVKCPPGRAMGSSGQSEADLDLRNRIALARSASFSPKQTAASSNAPCRIKAAPRRSCGSSLSRVVSRPMRVETPYTVPQAAPECCAVRKTRRIANGATRLPRQ